MTSALASATSTPSKTTLNGAAAAAAAAAPPPVPSKDPIDDPSAPSLAANGQPGANSSVLADADAAAVSKSDSLGRRAGVVRKAAGSGSIGSRSSLQMKRESAGGSEVVNASHRGVELHDRPFDD